MEKRFINFGSISQFRSVIKDIQHAAQYQGKDENDEPVFDRLAIKPVVTAIATEKIHGTNAGVCYDNLNGFWVQSKNNIITVEKDNAGCAFAAMTNQAEWQQIIFELATEHNINLDENTISVFYEWAGGNIQQKSALSGLDKRAMIFQHFKVTPHDEDLPAYWKETIVYSDFGVPAPDLTWARDKDKNIFNTMDFGTQVLEIDFERPDLFQNAVVKLIEDNEMHSPVGKHFEMEDNILEGYVFSFSYKGELYKFKCKGEEHSKGSGKVKALKAVDSVLEQKKIDFVNDHGCTESRLQQMYDLTFDTLNGGEGDMTGTGKLIGAVMKDIIKEESDRLLELGLEPKSVNSYVAKVVRGFLESKINEEIGL